MTVGRTRGSAGNCGGPGAAVATGLAELSGWAASLAWRDVPESIRRRVAKIFADDLAAIVAARDEPELGGAWAVDDAYHKVHACCQYGHAAVEATLALLESRPHADAARDLRNIRVETHWRARKLDNFHPATTLAARFSLQHILATTTHHGHAGAPAFHADTLSNPAIAALREKVVLAPFEPELDPPDDRPARVTWEPEDGSRIAREALSARGGPDRPFTEAEIRTKVRGILDEPYPGLPEAMMEAMDLAPGVLARPWHETVARADGPAGGLGVCRPEASHG